MISDSSYPEVVHALRDYRAEVERTLLGLAWSRGDATDSRDVLPFSEPSASPIESPFSSSKLSLRDPGGWPGAVHNLLQGEAAKRLRDLDLDVGVLALAEVWRLERAQVGPADGLLRRKNGHCEAWLPVLQAVQGDGNQLLERVSRTKRKKAILLPSICRALDALRQEVATQPEAAVQPVAVPLLRLAAADTLAERYLSEKPIPVLGAPGWAVEVHIEPTFDGAWMVSARRTWLPAPSSPPPSPTILLTLQVEINGRQRQHQETLSIESGTAVWYEEQPLGEAPMLLAEVAPA